MNVDVVIAGGGPVGTTLGIALGRRGVSHLVVERQAEIYPLPRAIVMDAEVRSALVALGVSSTLSDHLTTMTRADFVQADGTEIMGIDTAGLVLFGVPAVSCHYQPELEQFLQGEAASAGSIRRDGVEVVDHRVDADGVDVALSDGTTVRAKYLVACDGASSAIRKREGIALTDLRFDQEWIVVDVELDEATKAKLPDATRQVCDPKRPTTLVRGHRNYYRWEFQLQPDEDPAAMNERESVKRLLAPWVNLDAVRILRHARYRFHGLVAQAMSSGRVFLAGDSAHQMPPFMGQGLNSGMRDAFNLAWKLALVLGGKASPALLETYSPERIAHSTDTVAHSVDTGRLIDQLAGRVSHGMDNSAGYGGPRPAARLGAGFHRGSDERVGSPFPHIHLIDPTFVREGRFAVVSSTPMTSPLTMFAREVDSLVLDASLVGTDYQLVRPDGYVAAIGATQDDVRRLAAELSSL